MTFLGQLSYLAAWFLIIDYLIKGPGRSGLDIARNQILEWLRSPAFKKWLEDLGKPTERR